MPPSSIKATANCCTSREPPSPEGLAPRPAPSAGITALKDGPPEHARSWTSADAHDLQAIFEDEIRAHDDAALRGIIRSHPIRGHDDDGPDGETSESDPDVDAVRPERSSSTLQAVTEKLRKHLSIDYSAAAAAAKRRSRSSVGVSDEEVRRRAELRRFRERRIQEELSNESIYDDDAKPLSDLLGACADGEVPDALPELPADFIPLAELSASKVNHERIGHPRMGSKTSVGGDSPAPSSPEMFSDSVDMSTTLGNSSERNERHRLSPILSALDINESESKIYIPSRKASSALDMTLDPAVSASRLPSNVELDTKSPWRLSFSSEHRGQGLRKLSHANSSTVPPITDHNTKISLVGDIHAHSQLLNRYPASMKRYSKSDPNLDDTQSHVQTCCGSMDFGGVDGGGDIAPHLHEMDIPAKLAPKRVKSSISSPQLSSWGSHQRADSSPKVSIDQARRMRHTEELVASIDGSLKIWSEIKLDISPFRSKSAAAVIPLPVENSRFNLFSYLPRSKKMSRATAPIINGEKNIETQVQGEENRILGDLPGLTTILSATSTPNGECASPLDNTALSPRAIANEDASGLPSETSSFRVREEELSNLQSRFAERRVLSTPVSSKFREEFDKPAIPARKPSVLARLAKLARRSYDGNTDGTVDRADLLMTPIPNFEPSELLRSPNIKSPGGFDEAEAFWGGGLKGKGKESEKEEKKGMFGRKKSVAGGGNKRGFGIFGKKKKSELSAAEQYEQQLQERLAVKELVMDSWEMEMEATAAKAKTKSRNIVKKIKPAALDFRFPASWARFPSHDRQERVLSANRKDKVEIVDFAKLGKKEDGEVLWCLAHDDEGHHTEVGDIHRKKGIGERFILKVEKELYEFDTQDEQRSQTSGRRGSLTVGCELEYPELEILPVMMVGGEEMLKLEVKREAFKETVRKGEELDEIARLLGGFGGDAVTSEKREASLGGDVEKGKGKGKEKGIERSEESGSSTAVDTWKGSVVGCGVNSAGASDWEDEVVMSSSDEREVRCSSYLGISDPEYYRDCVMVTKSTFVSPMGTPGGTLNLGLDFHLRTDVLEELLLRVPADERGVAGKRKGEESLGLSLGRRRDGSSSYRRTWSGEDWEGYGYKFGDASGFVVGSGGCVRGNAGGGGVYGDGDGDGGETGGGNGDGDGSGERKRSLGTLLLSESLGSEEALLGELRRKEDEERAGLLRTVEVAFGGGCGGEKGDGDGKR